MMRAHDIRSLIKGKAELSRKRKLLNNMKTYVTTAAMITIEDCVGHRREKIPLASITANPTLAKYKGVDGILAFDVKKAARWL